MKLHLYLKKRGLTVSQFSRLSGIPIPTVWRIATKENYNPTMAVVSRIVKAAKGQVTPKDFMPEVPNETTPN